MTNPSITARGPIPATPATTYEGKPFTATSTWWSVNVINGAVYVETVLHGDTLNASAYGIAHPPIPGRPWWLIEWAPGYPPAPEWATTAAAGMLADLDAQARREARAEKQADRRVEEAREVAHMLGGAL